MELITKSALQVGFGGGLVVDYPHSTRAKKYFLCLFAGVPQESVKLPEPILDEEAHVKNIPREPRKMRKRGERRPAFKSREWVLARKERDRRKGKETRPDSKYTGRRRRKIVI